MSQSSSKKTRQSEYITALVECNGNKSLAGKVTDIPRQTYHRWFKDDKEFKEKTDEIFPRIERELFEECIRRAKEKSDILMMFTLKSLNPERYDDAIRKQAYLKEEPQTSELSDIDISDVDIRELLKEMNKLDPIRTYPT